jgi:DNA-directed RNA polymerase specialized sigma24 family protein
MGPKDRHPSAGTNTSPRRQPRGVREGGRFAPGANPESTVELSDLDGIAETQRLARGFIRRYGLHDHAVNGYMSAEDLTQDAVMAYLVAAQTERPEGVDLPIATIAKRSIIRALDAGDHKRHAAMKLFDQERVAREGELDRPLTSLELDQLSQKVRTSLPASHRPTEGFHRPRVVARSFDEMPEDARDEVFLQASEDEVRVELSDFSEGSAGDRAAQLKFEGNQVAARALMWDAIAERAGAPLCAVTPIGKRAAIRARASVMEAGGPLTCARSYLESGSTVDDLFAPFGPVDDEQRRSVCDVLSRHEHYADDLWRIAVSQAEGRSV